MTRRYNSNGTCRRAGGAAGVSSKHGGIFSENELIVGLRGIMLRAPMGMRTILLVASEQRCEHVAGIAITQACRESLSAFART
jgi:hypothetical protein